MPASMQRSVWLAGGAALLVVLGGVALWWRLMTDSHSNPVAVAVAPAKRGEKSLAVLLPGDADKAAKLLQSPGAGTASGGVSLDSAEVIGSDKLVLSGHAPPGATLNLYAGDRPLGVATAD